MKWALLEAEPITDYLIQRYIDIMDGNAARGRNLFDIGTVHHDFENETLLKLTPHQTQHLAEEVHEMLIIRDFGSMEFKLKINSHVKKVKFYQKLGHDLLSVIPKATLDNMSVTMRTIITRHKQMSTLLRHWERLSPSYTTFVFDMHSNGNN
jgi:hypothetical protein